MILRLFAKIHARSRRRFFRFTPWQRLVLVVGVFAVLLGIGEVLMANHVAKHLPWFAPSHRVYLLWTEHDSFREHISVAAAALSHVSDVETTEWELILDSMMQTRASHYGLVIPDGDDAQPLLFAVQPQHAIGGVPARWMMTTVANDTVVAISPSVISKPADFVWPWWKALKLRALWAQFQAAAYLQSEELPPFYGSIQVLDGGWNVFASTQAGPIRQAQVNEATVQEVPMLVSRINAQAFPGVESLSSVWQSLLHHPIEFKLHSGLWTDLVDPFTATAVWSMRSYVSAEQAQGWLQTVLDTLMLTFPLAEQRLLPDRGIVYELKRKADFFLPANTTLDLATYPSGSFTYPRGQITYVYANGALQTQNGIAENTIFQPACQIPEALFAFSSSGQAMGITMWRSLFFGLDKKKITLCLRW